MIGGRGKERRKKRKEGREKRGNFKLGVLWRFLLWDKGGRILDFGFWILDLEL